MRIDHLVINVDEIYQTDPSVLNSIRDCGFPYEPKWGKGTSGFKASNIWIGSEYFEMIRLLKQSGGGWREEWVNKYNSNHRGLICLFIETEEIQKEYFRLRRCNINITEPEFLEFKWFFGLLTRTMPWQNSYLPFFEGAPFQLGFQQMKDKASTEWMRQYMVPNSNDKGINSIASMKIYGNYTERDRWLIRCVFPDAVESEKDMVIQLSNKQTLSFIQDETHSVEVFTLCNSKQLNDKSFNVHNVKTTNSFI